LVYLDQNNPGTFNSIMMLFRFYLSIFNSFLVELHSFLIAQMNFHRLPPRNQVTNCFKATNEIVTGILMIN